MTSEQQRVVVIGGGLAGLRLAARLGARDGARDGARTEVTVLGEESHVPYNRVLLAEVLAGRYAPEVTALPDPGPALRRGVRAVRVDRADRTVHCDDGSTERYDALVLATGSNAVLPPLRGLFEPTGRELPDGVHAFRTMDDCLALTAAVAAGSGVRAVVIGGGLLGVSAARALAERGAQVVLAQQGERLMERQLDADASALLHAHLTTLGIEIHTGCRVRGLTTKARGRRPARHRSRVRRRIPARRGCRRTGLRRAAPDRARARRRARRTHRDRGGRPAADQRPPDPRHRRLRRARRPGVRPRGPRAGTGRRPGGAAGRHHRRGRPGYTGTRALTRLTLGTAAGTATAPGGPGPLDLAAFGETTPLPGDDVVRLADATRRTYRKVVVRGDRLVGGVLLGELSTVGALARSWEDAESLTDLFHLLTDDGGS